MVGLKIDPLLTNRVLVFNAKLIIGRRSAKDFFLVRKYHSINLGLDAKVTEKFLDGIC